MTSRPGLAYRRTLFGCCVDLKGESRKLWLYAAWQGTWAENIHNRKGLLVVVILCGLQRRISRMYRVHGESRTPHCQAGVSGTSQSNQDLTTAQGFLVSLPVWRSARARRLHRRNTSTPGRLLEDSATGPEKTTSCPISESCSCLARVRSSWSSALRHENEIWRGNKATRQ